MIKKIIYLGSLTALLCFCLTQYLGYNYFSRYKKLRDMPESPDRSFLSLERSLTRAIRFSKNPVFYYELGQLYLQWAYKENDLGLAGNRDQNLDKAIAAFCRGIGQNPIDAYAFNALGYAYQLYNYPLFTYMEKGRLFMKQALDLRPKDEFLTSNIMYVYLRQWNFLGEIEKKFVFNQLKREWKDPPYVFWPLRQRWIKDLGSLVEIRQILIQDPEFWSRYGRFFE